MRLHPVLVALAIFIVIVYPFLGAAMGWVIGGEPSGGFLAKGGGFLRASLPLGDSRALVLRVSVFPNFGFDRSSTYVLLSLGLGGRD